MLAKITFVEVQPYGCSCKTLLAQCLEIMPDLCHHVPVIRLQGTALNKCVLKTFD